jgi:hypothetical protein
MFAELLFDFLDITLNFSAARFAASSCCSA